MASNPEKKGSKAAPRSSHRHGNSEASGGLRSMAPAVIGLAVACATAAWMSFGAASLKKVKAVLELKRMDAAKEALLSAVTRGRPRIPVAGGADGAATAGASDGNRGGDVLSAIQRVLSGMEQADEVKVERVSIRVEREGSQAEMPVAIYTPAGAGGGAAAAPERRPAVIVIHATGGSKEAVEPLTRHLAGMGFVAAAMDCRYHGARADGALPRGGYEEAIIRAYNGEDEKPFLLDMAWDALHLVDHLASRGDVDASRIGMTGISLGGMVTWFAAAMDERVAAAAPLIGVQGWKWAVDHNQWLARTQTIPRVFELAAEEMGKEQVDSQVVRRVWDRILPGLLDRYDAPMSLPCIAPRPLLVLNGEEDPRCPKEGLKEAVAATARRYQELGCPDKFEVFLQEKTGHKPTNEMYQAAYNFFKLHLMPAQPAAEL